MDEALKDNKGVSGSDLEEDNNITLMDSESAESVPEDKTDGSINTSESTDETKKTEETAGEAVSVQTGESDTGCESAEEKTEVFLDEAEAMPVGSEVNAKKQKRPKKDIFDIKEDIKYRGPFSYRHFKVFGWICIVLSQILAIERLKQRVVGTGSNVFTSSDIVGYASSLALPLLLISVFVSLLRKRSNYGNAIITYGSLSLLVIGVSLFFYNRYMLGLAQPLAGVDNKAAADSAMIKFFNNLGGFDGFFAYNIFIDMLLCSLVMFFVDYYPKRVFTGKRIIFFRAFVILPVLYEIVCISIKILASTHRMDIPLWVSPFLSTKPTLSMIVFLSIVRYVKYQKKKFLKTGRTEEEYEIYQNTNIASFRFAKHLSIIMLVYGLLDLIIGSVLALIHVGIMYNLDTVMNSSPEANAIWVDSFEMVASWGFGETADMMLLIPFMLLFSYSRTHKHSAIDNLIPLVGVIALVLIYFDGIFQIVQTLLTEGLDLLGQPLGFIK